MGKQIVVDVKFGADGSIDENATREEFANKLATLVATSQEDFDSLAVDIVTFLLSQPGLRSLPSGVLCREIHGMRIERGDFKGKSFKDRDAAYTRLEEVLPEYVKANPDMFHVGKKVGIAVRFVPGEESVDAKGEKLFDAEGNPVQRYRYTDEEWFKLTAPKAKPDSAPVSTPNA